MVRRILGILFTAAAPLIAQDGKLFIRVLSPANGAVVRPGQTLPVRVTGSGGFIAIGAANEDVFAVLSLPKPDGTLPPLGKPPWTIAVQVPREVVGKTTLAVFGATRAGIDATTEVTVDVEPAEIPPVTFNHPSVFIPTGECVELILGSPGFCLNGPRVLGTYPDGTVVELNRSTRINFTSLNPAVARVTQNGKTLAGISEGSTKLVVFGKYSVDVIVRGPQRR